MINFEPLWSGLALLAAFAATMIVVATVAIVSVETAVELAAKIREKIKCSRWWS